MVLPCPCCGYLTIDSDDEVIVDICEVCHWQYDAVAHDHPEISIGANYISLNEARKNFNEMGACDTRFIGFTRPPHDDEIPH